MNGCLNRARECFFLARDDSRYLIPKIDLGRVVADLFDFEGKSFLVTSDYYTAPVCVIRKLKDYFAWYGIPGQLVSDNGSQFMSRDFLKFAKEWDFEHLTSSPHHNKSNGKAESSVKEAKKIFRKCNVGGSDVFLACCFLSHKHL